MTAPATSPSENIYWLDAFCGAGGASTGIERVHGNFVAVGINHDIRAIEAHKANHPNTVHLNDDIRKVKLSEVAAILHSMGIKRINIWWSAECTHLSNAKGGASRDADSRMLSEDLFRYIHGLEAEGISVDMVHVENVKEFFTWTALVPKVDTGKKGHRQLERQYVKAQVDLMEAVVSCQDYEASVTRELIDMLSEDLLKSNRYATEKGELLLIPDTASKGSMYMKWLRHMQDLGYVYDYRMLNAADFGAYQSRDRYFGVFIKQSLGIRPAFPKPTHAKKPAAGSMFEKPLEKWKACRDILDLENRGESILYGRKGKKPLVAATLARIKYGINKFPGEAVMIDRSNSGASPVSASEPAPTVRASFENGLVNVTHVDNHSYNAAPVSIEEPLPTAMANRDKYLMNGFVVPSAYGNAPYRPSGPLLTLTANRKHQYLCSPFLAHQYSSSGSPNQCSPVDAPTWAVTTSNHQGLCIPLIVDNYGKSPAPRTADGPLGAVTTKPKSALGSCFLVPQFGMSKATSTGEPVGAITTNPKFSLNTVMLMKYYGTGDNAFPVCDPMGTVTTKDRFGLVNAQFVQYYYGGGAGNSDQRAKDLQDPLGVVGTHHTPGLVQAQFVAYKQGSGTEHGSTRVLGTDGPNASVCQAVLTATSKEWPIHIGLNPPGNKWHPAWMRIEGDYLVDNRIVDVFYRMLKVSELKLAQGFPANYILDPKSETVAKKHIGNAVHVDAAKALVNANCGPDSAYFRIVASVFA